MYDTVRVYSGWNDFLMAEWAWGWDCSICVSMPPPGTKNCTPRDHYTINMLHNTSPQSLAPYTRPREPVGSFVHIQCGQKQMGRFLSTEQIRRSVKLKWLHLLVQLSMRTCSKHTWAQRHKSLHCMCIDQCSHHRWAQLQNLVLLCLVKWLEFFVAKAFIVCVGWGEMITDHLIERMRPSLYVSAVMCGSQIRRT